MTINPNHRTFRGSTGWRALLLGALSALLVTVGVAAPAQAAEIPGAITSVAIEHAGPYDSGDAITVDCTWAVPDRSAPGDFFTLQLPRELKWDASASVEFPLMDPTGTKVVAQATVDSAGLITFVLTDYVLTHPLNVSGECHFSVRLAYSNTTFTPETIVLDFDGFTVPIEFVPADHPCAGDCDAPWDARPASKALWWVDDGTGSRLGTRIDTPASPSAGSVTIEDTPSAGLALDCSRIEYEMGDALDQNGNIAAPRVVPPSTVTCNASGLIAIWDSVPAGQYISLMVYATTTDASLAEYTNRATVTYAGAPATEVSAVAKRQGSGGTGTGEDGVGGVSVTKHLRGAGAAEVPLDRAFTVDYSYELDGDPVSGRLVLRADETGALEDLPTGTVVTLSEATPERVTGLEWESPEFAGDGVTVTPTGAEVTIGEGTSVAVVLTNPVSRVGADPEPPTQEDPKPAVPSVPEPPSQVNPKPSEPSAPEPPVASVPQLPVTGSLGSGVVIGIAGVLLMVGSAVLIIRTQRSARGSSGARH